MIQQGANNSLKFDGVSVINPIRSTTAVIIRDILKLKDDIMEGKAFVKAPSQPKLH